MTTLSRATLLFLSATLVATTLACSSATPAPNGGATDQDIKAISTGEDGAAATSDPTAHADASADADADAGGTCCDLATKPDGYYPEGISCCSDNGWHASRGGGQSDTCAAFGGVGTVCEAAPTEVCGGPPMNAFCAQCPGGINGYKQNDGQPTCDCCATTNDGKTP
ncbi:MAG: hypothetical protein JWP87_5409 [Labilithrix sp.]|jgi:hypothetical protein|nr:hypothetical protein [Labilithrix sp.]